jgi:hypothetical protein
VEVVHEEEAYREAKEHSGNVEISDTYTETEDVSTAAREEFTSQHRLSPRPHLQRPLSPTERYLVDQFGWVLPEGHLKAAFKMSDDEEVLPPPAHCKVITAKTLCTKLASEVKAGVEKLQKVPTLVGFLSSADPAARVYAEWTGRTAKEKCVAHCSMYGGKY